MGDLPTAIGPYRIIRLLGEGGMGAVYEARQDPLDRRVALKTLHPEHARSQDAVARFFNEARVLSRLEHPSIVQVFDFGTAPEGTAYLVMEFLRGESMAHRLRDLADRGERLATSTALQFTWQVADILSVAHAQGIVHRDIKPDNLMLVADPVAPGGERVKVLDFGIAKLTKGTEQSGVKTDTQAVIGTPQYMSPEQCAGAGGVDAKTDVYSLGCVLYEALGGRPPFVADGAGQLVGMHLYQIPPTLVSLAPKLPSKVADFVHLLLTKDKAKRPSMSEACDELGRILSKLSGAGAVVRSRPPTSTDPDATRPVIRAMTTFGQSIGQWGSSSPRHTRLIAASAVGLLIAVLATVLLTRTSHQSGSTAVPPQSAAAPAVSVADGQQMPPLKPAGSSAVVGGDKSSPPIATGKPLAKQDAPRTLPSVKSTLLKPAHFDGSAAVTPIARPKPAKTKSFGYED